MEKIKKICPCCNGKGTIELEPGKEFQPESIIDKLELTLKKMFGERKKL